MTEPRPAYIGPFRIDGSLGEGGMGEVYRGYDEALKRAVAVKRVRTQRAASPQVVARFRREAQALAAVTHPNVVRIHSIGETDSGELYLAMEFVEGVALGSVAGGAWPIESAADAVRQAAAGLGAAHAAGIIHRDVKPDNLLIGNNGLLRVVDFGLAMRPDSMTDQVTADNMMVGTLPYMAPEQLTGAAVGPASDVFALGVVLFQLLAGEHPFIRDTRNATALAIASVSHPQLREVRPEVPPDLAEIVSRCMSMDPAARFADGAALAEALAPWAPSETRDLARVASEPQAFRDLLGSATNETEAATPKALGLATPTPTPAKPFRWGWVALLVLVASASWWTARITAEEPNQVRRTVVAAPTRAQEQQTIAVLDFDGAEPGEHRVIADLVRLQLEWAPPAQLRVLPLTGLVRNLRPNLPLDGRLDLKSLARKPGAEGRVDQVLRGREFGDQLVLERVDVASGKTEWTGSVPLDSAHDTAAAAAKQVAAGLGVALKAGALPPVSEAAYAAFLGARAAERVNDYAAIDRKLGRALALAPDFVEANLPYAGWLRSTNQNEELGALCERLLRRDDLHPRQRGFLEAHRAYAQKDLVGAVRSLEQVTQDWPFFVDAYNALLALRFHSRGVRDLEAVERHARQALAYVPFGEHAASRLVRALAIRGRAADAERVLREAGLDPATPAANDVWAELYLHQGRFSAAIDRFDSALAKAPEDVYARNLRYAALILDGRCADASTGLLTDLGGSEIKAGSAPSDWTIHLALNALVCQRSWRQAHALLDRWQRWGTSGAHRAWWWRPRLALAAGAKPAAVAEQIHAALTEAPEEAHAPLLRVLARVGQDAERVTTLANRARGKATELGQEDLQGWMLAHKALDVRARQLRGEPPRTERLVLPWGHLRTERQLSHQVEAMALRAQVLAESDARAGAEAWAEVAALGYPRLYATDLYLLAGEQVAEDD